MADTLRIEIDNKLEFDVYFKKFKEADENARVKVGIQLINNIVQGEGGTNVKPPILTGTLWGSGSVFVGSKNVYITQSQGGNPTPAVSHSDKDGVITIGFNTPYAARWHNNSFKPGPVSKQAGNVSDQYITKHLQADAQELTKLYAMLVKKATGG